MPFPLVAPLCMPQPLTVGTSDMSVGIVAHCAALADDVIRELCSYLTALRWQAGAQRLCCSCSNALHGMTIEFGLVAVSARTAEDFSVPQWNDSRGSGKMVRLTIVFSREQIVCHALMDLKPSKPQTYGTFNLPSKSDQSNQPIKPIINGLA